MHLAQRKYMYAHCILADETAQDIRYTWKIWEALKRDFPLDFASAIQGRRNTMRALLYTLKPQLSRTLAVMTTVPPSSSSSSSPASSPPSSPPPPLEPVFHIGTLVRVNTTLAVLSVRESMTVRAYMGGRIGIVHGHDNDAFPRICFGGNVVEEETWAWRPEWLTVLDADVVAQMDVAWLKALRDTYARRFPDKHRAVAKRRIMGLIAGLRAKLSDLERELATLE